MIFSINDCYELEHLPKLKCFMERYKREFFSAEFPLARSFLTLNGDFLGPSSLSQFDEGKHMVDAMNALAVDYICLGNHVRLYILCACNAIEHARTCVHV